MSGPPACVIVGVELGRWASNTYVLADRERGTALVVDPGEGAGPVVRRVLDALLVSATQILLTHGHLDHVWSAPDLASALDVPIRLHPHDQWLWDDPAAGIGLPARLVAEELGLDWQPNACRPDDLADGEQIREGAIRLTVRHTPGHTPGHVTFESTGLGDAAVALAVDPEDPGVLAAGAAPTVFARGAREVLLAGDLLFAGTIGRTDFPRGSPDAMMRSLATGVLALPDDVLVLAGHGPETTIGRERAENPFLRQAARLHGHL